MADAVAPTPCATCATLAPTCEHRFKVETSLYLPDCLRCGLKAGRCDCPLEFVAPQPEPPPVGALTLEASCRVLGADAYDPARRVREAAAVAVPPYVPAVTWSLPCDPRPWCPAHGRAPDPYCQGCGADPGARAPLAPGAVLLPDAGVITGAEMRKWRAEATRDAAIVAAHEHGAPVSQIAAKFDLSPKRIGQIVDKAQFERREARQKDETKA